MNPHPGNPVPPCLRGFFLWLLATLLVAFAVPPAAAQGKPDISVSASASEVEVGEPFTVELKALSEQGGDAPSNPELRAPAGFTVSGPRISTQTVAQFGGGSSSVKTGLGATWTLIASSPGHFTIPAPTVTWGGSRLKSRPIEINVVPATGRARPQPANPFLLPGGSGTPWPFGGPGQPGAELDDSDGPDAKELALDTAPDEKIFLRTTLDKQSAVVGEQVTATFYIYYRVDFEMSERKEAPLSDFLRVPLLKNPGTDPPVYASVGGHRYAVRLLDKIAIFPVHAGDLHTGSMNARFAGRKIGSRVLRESNDLVVHATEPPLAGRPTGYAPGDVGSFSLTATVQPKRIDQGGAVAVTVKVSGTGNLPGSLRPPARTGIEWLDPEKRDAIEAPAGVVGGWRTFGYVVRIKESGNVDLGKIELPFWDPSAKRYQVATAELGVVEVTPVTPSAAPSASGSAGSPDAPGRDPFASMSPARTSLGAFVPPAEPPLGGFSLWFLVAAPPLAVVLYSAGERGARYARRRRAAARTGGAARSARALEEAQAAATRGDAKELAAAVERALHHAIEASTGLLSRGVLLRELPAELDQRGVPQDLAERVRDAISRCDSVRFDPLATAADLGELAAQGRALVKELGRVR